MSTRGERAARLRGPVGDLVKRSSLREAAKQTKTSVGAIRNLLDGKTPQESTLDDFEQWADRAGIVLERVVEETPEEAVAQSEVDQFQEILIDTVRMAGGRQNFSPEERRRIQLDVVEGIIRLREAEGKDARALYELRATLKGEMGEGVPMALPAEPTAEEVTPVDEIERQLRQVGDIPDPALRIMERDSITSLVEARGHLAAEEARRARADALREFHLAARARAEHAGTRRGISSEPVAVPARAPNAEP